MNLPFFSIDIEPTNRCNAKCYFCPRDHTPHQGLMSPETFDQSLRRTLEFRGVAAELFDREVTVNLCGLGEALLNRHTPSFVRKVRDAGLPCALATNGALLDEQKGRQLLGAGLQHVAINAGEEGDDYEEIYKLPFERTRENIVRFKEMAGDSCLVQIVLVNHRGDASHLDAMTDYWRDLGIDDFFRFDLINRGGALFVDHMQYESLPERAEVENLLRERGQPLICPTPFMFLFIGYDGQYYLCCSDWKKEVPLGSVFDVSFADVTAQKLVHVNSREPVCRTCNLDPINRLTDTMRAHREGELTESDFQGVVAELSDADVSAREVIEALESAYPTVTATVPRVSIPVRAI